ncbi:MAG: zf-HC2 domain-containing protein [Candidatus Omnitrophica bacterium]|nr:zf-HC2 domain-containing protein [Candidatus Omnitrophota bacterium]
MTTPDNWEQPTDLPLTTSCKQAARLVSISFERKLTWREYTTMRIHLMMCKTCTFYGRQIKALRAIFTRHEEVLNNTPCTCDEQLAADAKQRMKDIIQQHK